MCFLVLYTHPIGKMIKTILMLIIISLCIIVSSCSFMSKDIDNQTDMNKITKLPIKFNMKFQEK